ncbi:MAG: amino acid adenylation domain-containing protein [Chloroflexota bacterium]
MSTTHVSKQVDFDPFAQGDVVEHVPTTEAQKEIWLSAQLSDGANCAFNESLSLHFEGHLNVAALQTAVNQLTDRHSALRATISQNGEHLVIAQSVTIPVEMIDLSSQDKSAIKEAVEAETIKSVTTPFDLLNGPLLRVSVLKTAVSSFTVLFTVHHIVGDGWSIAVMLDDMSKFYTGAIYGVPPQMPPAGQFGEYAKNEPNSSQAEAFWHDRFDPLPPTMDLPIDFPRPAVRTFNARRIDWTFDEELVKSLKRIGGRHGCTFFTTMLAIFDLFMARLSGETDIVVGTPAAGQSIVGEDFLVGHCVNMLPIRAEVPMHINFSEYLKQIRTTVLDAYEHQAYTFGSLLKQLPIQRDKSRIPLVPVIFNIDQESHGLKFGSMDGNYFSNHRRFENFELFVNAVDARSKFILECTYNSDLFSKETMTAWMASFEQLCRSIVADPTVRNDKLPLLNNDAERQLIEAYNDTAVSYDKTATIPDLFEAVVTQFGEKTAVFNSDSQLTFNELNQQANQLAHLLQTHGVKPDQFVGIALERTPQLMVGLLGIHKAGGAYLPLDPAYPNDRLAYMLEDTQAEILITHSELIEELPAFNGTVILIDKQWAEIKAQSIETPERTSTSQSLAYVIHTSGSTGKPKGVLIPQQNVVNFLLTMANQPGMTAEDSLLAVTTLSFDIAVLELFLPMITGATLYIAPQEDTVNGEKLAQIIDEHGITIMQATPVTWQLLLASGWRPIPSLKILSGGEALSRHLADQLLAGGGEVWNMYGPTETTIWSSVAKVNPTGSITIGDPIANTQFLVLDEHQQVTPIGIPGELYIGGDGVAQGYLNRPELTAERFVDLRLGVDFNCQSLMDSCQFYRTGDLVRRRPDGQIEWMSRMDFQVKVRGFRIELGEIEYAILQETAVQEAVAIVRQDVPNQPEIAAYIVTSSAVTSTETELVLEIRTALKQRLPDYMVPSTVTIMDKFPQTNNGKIDRKALPAPTRTQPAQLASFVPPETETEQKIAAIWAKVLQFDKVGRHDNFFEIGGHSLLAVQIMIQIREAFSIELPLGAMFEHPTVGELAQRVETAVWSAIDKNTQPTDEEEVEEFEF